jgi:hypothetical protein
MTESIVTQAQDVLNQIATNGSSDLDSYSKSIQDILNGVLTNQGIITPEQKNQLDEQIRIAKVKLLEAETKKTFLRIGIVSGSLILGFGFLWYITRDKFKK